MLSQGTRPGTHSTISPFISIQRIQGPMNSTPAIATTVPVEIADSARAEQELQLWSALTLGALQKQLTGHENDPKFSEARTLVDGLATQFATANPIDIANYFEAVEALAAIKGDGRSRLDSISDPYLDPTFSE